MLASDKVLPVLRPGWALPHRLPIPAQWTKLVDTRWSVGPFSCSAPARLTLPCILLWCQESVSAPFLVDSGTDDSFISQELAMQARIPFETLPEPRYILGPNGEVLAKVTH